MEIIIDLRERSIERKFLNQFKPTYYHSSNSDHRPMLIFVKIHWNLVSYISSVLTISFPLKVNLQGFTISRKAYYILLL